MTSSEAAQPNYSRRILWLGIFVVLAIGLYTAGWFYFAGKLVDITRDMAAKLGSRDIEAGCENPLARGFPFRMGLYCDRVFYADPKAGLAAQGEGLRTAAQVYQPFHVVGELDVIRLQPRQGVPYRVDAKDVRFSTRLASPLPRAASVVAKAVAVEENAQAGGAQLLVADEAEGHMRTNADDLDLAGRFNGLRATPYLLEGGDLPPFSGTADLTVINGAPLLRAGMTSLRGHSGTLRDLTITDGAASISLSGPFSITESGLLNGDFMLKVDNPEALKSTLAAAFPDQARQIETAMSGLSALGDNPQLPLTVKDGKARLGFIPLGEIPPL